MAGTGNLLGFGRGFSSGWGRPCRPNAKSAVPSGPAAPIERPDTAERQPDGRLRDPRTAENLHARAEALKPRRYVPPGEG